MPLKPYTKEQKEEYIKQKREEQLPLIIKLEKDYKLPNITGNSEKQIEFARAIRFQFLSPMFDVIMDFVKEYPEILNDFKDMRNYAEAKFWLDIVMPNVYLKQLNTFVTFMTKIFPDINKQYKEAIKIRDTLMRERAEKKQQKYIKSITAKELKKQKQRENAKKRKEKQLINPPPKIEEQFNPLENLTLP